MENSDCDSDFDLGDCSEEKCAISTNFIKYDIKSVRKTRQNNPLVKNKGKTTSNWFDVDFEQHMNFTYNFVIDD
jgi:hypothetical protein